MNKNITITICLMCLCVVQASAFIIEETIPDKISYSNGDLIIINMTANIQGLEIIPDFSPIDSNYNKEMVVVENNGFYYTIYYTITYSNARPSGNYNILLSAYSSSTNSSNTATIPLRLDNTGLINKTQHSEIIRFTIGTPDISKNITVKDGYIQICTPTGCETLTKADYEAARNIIISQGKVTLSNLTYDQLRQEITNSVTQSVNANVQQYINQIIEINKNLEISNQRVQDMIKYSQDYMANQTNQTQKLIKRNTTVTAVQGIFVMLLVILSFYIFYLKTNTTWLN